MKHKLSVIFGEDQAHKIYNNQLLSDEELEINLKKYSFNSLEEKSAFIKGMNEALGWNNLCIPELEFMKK
ncbi:hypothetical protein [Pedobacter cryotolerans]|uniref:Uncharacterized protein n=1 Tax=Pedobacter cryotolerans TaxID=2571270 RepID=A0A4V5NXY4_9SPHI|nr:hypothetical protein [Pedobacter cryotolerans]TKC01163.1 hypothetical protein FA045_07915 [Pedobacter cryotolerans]